MIRRSLTQYEGEMERFATILRNEATRSLDERNHLLERRRLEATKEMRDVDRAERRADMDARRQERADERTKSVVHRDEEDEDMKL